MVNSSAETRKALYKPELSNFLCDESHDHVHIAKENYFATGK
jgi:hypothetical protein